MAGSNRSPATLNRRFHLGSARLWALYSLLRLRPGGEMLRESVRSVGQRVISDRVMSDRVNPDKDALVDFWVLRQSLRMLIYVTTLLLVAVTASSVGAQTGQSGGATVSSRPSSRNLPSAVPALEKKA